MELDGENLLSGGFLYSDDAPDTETIQPLHSPSFASLHFVCHRGLQRALHGSCYDLQCELIQSIP